MRCTRNVKLLTRLYSSVAVSNFNMYLGKRGSSQCFAARTSTARFSRYGKGVASIGKLCRNVVSSTVGVRKACLGMLRRVSARALGTHCVRSRS